MFHNGWFKDTNFIFYYHTLNTKVMTIKYLRLGYTSFTICIYSLFNPIYAQFDGKIDGSLLETGLYFNDLHFSWHPNEEKPDIHTLNIAEFQFGFSNIKIENWLDDKKNISKINISGPELVLKKLSLNSKINSTDWITKEKLKRLEIRESVPKDAIKSIVKAIDLYRIDYNKLPPSLNELAINQYIDLDAPPFNSYEWSYLLNLPENIIANSTKINPIYKSKSIYYNFQNRNFQIDPEVDSLYNLPNVDWHYLFQMQNVSTLFSSKLDINITPDLSEFSIGMKRGQFKIINTSFTATPLNKLVNQTRINLPELTLETKNLMVNGTLSEYPIIHNGNGKFRIRNFEIKLPAGLGNEPEIKNLLETLGIWNNSLMIRLIDIEIEMINEFTGDMIIKLQTPFLKVNIEGDFSLRQNGAVPDMVLHNTQIKINPIALGIKKWIRNWEKKNNKELDRQGSVIMIKMEGPLSDPTIHGF